PPLAIIFRVLLVPGTAVMLALGWGAGVAVAQDRSLEYAVKATYLYKFAPFDICIVGDSSFADLVANGIAGQRVEGGHALAVRRVTTIEQENGCQVLF